MQRLGRLVKIARIGGTAVPPIHTKLYILAILQVCQAFAFKPITLKFGEVTNFWIF